MYSITVKGKANPKDKKMVRLEFIFFKTGYNRVSKVIKIVGPLKDWDQRLQSFKETNPDLIAKNKILLDKKLKYYSVVENWELEGKNWSPIQWSHCFDEKNEQKQVATPQIVSVSAFIDQLVEMFENTTRIKNGQEISSKNNARNYISLKNALKKFTLKIYHKSLSNTYFPEVNEKFIVDFANYIKLTGKANGNNAGLTHKLRTFRATCTYAKGKGLFEYNSKILFQCVNKDLKRPNSEPKAVSYEVVRKIANADKSKYNKRTQFYIDLFLFSFYTGGTSNIDVCHLTKDCIKDGMILYERIKTNKDAKAYLMPIAQSIIDKYKDKCFGNYVLPVFNKIHSTEQKRYDRVEYVTCCVTKALALICKDLKINEKLTWYSARGSFITKMIDEGFTPEQVAEQAGNSPNIIYKHYWKNTRKDEVGERMHSIF